MKHLKIHTLIWALICFIWVFVKVVCFYICNIIYFLWCFKFAKYGSYFYEEEKYFEKVRLKGILKSDKTPHKNIIDTFIHNFNYFD